MLVGAHMSISGGIDKSFQRSNQIGGNCLQIFAKTPRGRQFSHSNYDDVFYDNAKKEFEKYNQKRGVIHSVYLANLGKPYIESNQDRLSIIDDFIIANNLGFDGVNIHLGKYGEQTKNKAIDNMVDNVKEILKQTNNFNTKFIFENTAGQGTEIGWNFDELNFLINKLHNSIGKDIVDNKIGFCIDTCHAWAGGYDINNWNNVIGEFDKLIGLKKLSFIHLNDSKALLGSHLDRHASLGKGFIGLNALAQVIIWSNNNKIPIILETPQPENWEEEITILKNIVNGTYDKQWIENYNQKNYKTQYLKKFEKNILSDSLF